MLGVSDPVSKPICLSRAQTKGQTISSLQQICFLNRSRFCGFAGQDKGNFNIQKVLSLNLFFC